jgi:transposase
LEHSKTVIRNQVKANTRKNLSLKRAEEKGMALLEAASQSYPAIKRNDIRCEQVRDYAKRMANLKEKKEQLVQQMVVLSKER